MADQDMERLNRKVDEIAEGLRTLSASFDKGFGEVNLRFGEIDLRFGEIDKRFDAVDERFAKNFAEINEHFVEQRQYTELAFDTLRKEMREGFAEMRGEMRAGFEQIDRRLAIFIETQGGLNSAFAKASTGQGRRISALEHARRRRKS